MHRGRDNREMSAEQVYNAEEIKLERSILSCLLVSKECLIEGMQKLQPAYFTVPELRSIYVMIRDIFKNYNIYPTYEVIMTQIQMIYTDEERNDMLILLNSLKEEKVDITQFPFLLDAITKKVLKEKAEEAILQAYTDLQQNKLEEAFSKIREVMQYSIERADMDCLSLPDDDSLISYYLSQQNFEAVVDTGFELIDDALGGGFKRGDLVLIFGATSSGKSTLLTNIAIRGWLKGRRVAYLTNEMPVAQVMMKILSALTGIRYIKLRMNLLNDEERNRIEELLNILKKDANAGIKIYQLDPLKCTVDSVIGMIEQHIQYYPLDIFIVDGIDGADWIKNSHMTREEKQARMAFLLKSLALRYGFVALGATQQKGETYDRKTMRLEYIGYSMQKAHASDVVIGVQLYSNGSPYMDKIAAYLLKNRDGRKDLKDEKEVELDINRVSIEDVLDKLQEKMLIRREQNI